MAVASIHSVFRSLEALHHKGGTSVLAGGSIDWYEVMLFPPAEENEIFRAVQSLGKTPPDDFLRFWLLTNGANLFVNESGLHGVGVASTNLIQGLQTEEESFYGRNALADYVVFGRVNGAGDFLVLQLSTGRVLDGVHAELPREWRPIADSFTDWMARLVEADGRYYWLEALYEKARLES